MGSQEASGRKKSQKKGTCAAGQGQKQSLHLMWHWRPNNILGCVVVRRSQYTGGGNLFTSRRSLRSKSKKEIQTVMVKHSYLFSLINSLQFLIEKKKTLGFKYSAPSHTTICIHYLQLSNKHGADFQTFNLFFFNQKLFSLKTEISVSDYKLKRYWHS